MIRVKLGNKKGRRIRDGNGKRLWRPKKRDKIQTIKSQYKILTRIVKNMGRLIKGIEKEMRKK